MLKIFLTDSQQDIQFVDYPAGHPVQFVLKFKKIFPSIGDLLIPVLPEDDALEEVKWESNSKDFQLFKRLIQEWATAEIRLTAMSNYKSKSVADTLVKQAQHARKKFQQQQTKLNLLHADYIFLQSLHSLLDAELVELGAQFYVPSLRQQWRAEIPAQILNLTVQT